MKKPIEVKKKLKKVTEYTACFAFLMFLQGVGAPMVFADATAAINAKFEILWNLISAVVPVSYTHLTLPTTSRV